MIRGVEGGYRALAMTTGEQIDLHLSNNDNNDDTSPTRSNQTPQPQPPTPTLLTSPQGPLSAAQCAPPPTA